MAECSYARCVQQRRNIRRELQRWTKNMVHIVGLERIAEELMGRRKWKLYQESMSRNYLQPLNNNIKRTNNTITSDGDYHLHHNNNNNNNKKPASGAAVVELEEDPPADCSPRIRALGDIVDENDGQKENTSDDDRLLDWTPQTKCHFCVDGKLDSEHHSHGVLSPRHSDSETSESPSDSEAPPSLIAASRGGPASTHHQQQQRGVHHPVTPGNMTTIESVTTMASALAAVAALAGRNSPGAPSPHLPFYPPNLLTHNWYVANMARTFQQQTPSSGTAGATAAVTVDTEKASGGEQPLDLSKGSGNSAAPAVATALEQKVNVRLPTLDTKHIFNSDFRAKPRMSAVAGRRTYTEDELQAALRDIQSGKLGTRRAAVIYGIPRSTLRNKVYKLALERERESHLNSTGPSATLKLEEEEAMDDEKELSGAEEEKEVEKALQAPLLSMEDIIRFSNIENPPEALKQILEKSRDMWAGLDHSEVGPYIQNLMIASQNFPKQTDLQQIIPKLVKNMMVVDGGNNGTKSDMSDAEESSANVILKIPSFKPTSSKNGCEMYPRSGVAIESPPSDSASPPIKLVIKDVKDVIAQSISQKFQQSLDPAPRRPVIEMDFKRGGFTPPLGGVIKSQQYPSPPQKPPQQQQQQQSQNSGSGGKGTRPKRGKYRNYDRDSLVEAVRAVQRGEMSVHRAGSYYGVPHSTLEYKVKERHLMRPRKRDPKPNPVDEKIASLKQNDLNNKLKPVSMKAPQKFPPTSPNGMKLPLFESAGMPPLSGYNHSPFPFWTHPGFPPIPMDYGVRNPQTQFAAPNPEFFATQMMQKIQEESARTTAPAQAAAGPPGAIQPTLAKSARQMAESLLDGTGSNGSFLDGIIRSSLESGVPTSEESKFVKEEKNLAPENMSNKALLDQLCRNSRLTPLSKPTSGVPGPDGGASSGDESTTYHKGSSPLNFATGNSSQDENNTSSPPPPLQAHEKALMADPIELSNDSNHNHHNNDGDGSSSSSDDDESVVSERTAMTTTTTTDEPPLPAQPRIYLKQDLMVKQPEHLKRFRESSLLPDLERNGGAASVTESASSDNDMSQD